MTSSNTTKIIIQGIALQDNIIAVTHRYENGNEGPNLQLRTMIALDQLQPYGFSAYVALGDKSTGKEDKAVVDSEGSAIHAFLSINVHNFNTPREAHSAVVTQCEKLYEVRYPLPTA